MAACQFINNSGIWFVVVILNFIAINRARTTKSVLCSFFFFFSHSYLPVLDSTVML